MPTRTRRPRGPRLTPAERQHARRLARHAATLRTFRATEAFCAFCWPEEAKAAHSVIDRAAGMGEQDRPANDHERPWRFAQRCEEIETRMRLETHHAT